MIRSNKMYVYYVDNINGSNANDGFSPDKPIKDYKTITLQPGPMLNLEYLIRM